MRRRYWSTRSATGAQTQKLIFRLDHTMRSIRAMLSAILDINQIEAGIVQAKIVPLFVNDVLNRLWDRFREQAAALGIELLVVPCSLVIATDPALLEQMLSNLIGNALKYTRAGRVLVGVRRRGPDRLRIEVWDTGIGIPADQLEIIFEEYHLRKRAERCCAAAARGSRASAAASVQASRSSRASAETTLSCPPRLSVPTMANRNVLNSGVRKRGAARCAVWVMMMRAFKVHQPAAGRYPLA